MPRIPEETIQQIIAATDIVELVGRYVKLKRAGSNYSGLCPFHTEKTPSFSVSPSRNSYHCFGCGAGGSAIRFLQEHDGLTFPEAVKRLAEAAGIRIEEGGLGCQCGARGPAAVAAQAVAQGSGGVSARTAAAA